MAIKTMAQVKKQRSSKAVPLDGKILTLDQLMIAEGYKHQFEAVEKLFELSDFAKNFPLELIPMEKSIEVMKVILGDRIKSRNIDPNKNDVFAPMDGTIRPQIQALDYHKLYVCIKFQRAMIPKSILNIHQDFDPSAVSVVEVMRKSYKGKVYDMVWDSNHTGHICVMNGYTKLICKVVDADAYTDEEMLNDGTLLQGKSAPLSEEDRFAWAIYKAGKNFIRNNHSNKMLLDDFDRYKVQVNIQDYHTLIIESILRDTSCQIVRKPKNAGDVKQVRNIEDTYAREDTSGIEGTYLRKALAFHTTTWPDMEIKLEIFKPMAKLYELSEKVGKKLDNNFEKKLGAGMKKYFGGPDDVQLGLKKSYEKALNTDKSDFVNNDPDDKLPSNHTDMVLVGIQNLYQQKIYDHGDVILPQAKQTWTI